MAYLAGYKFKPSHFEVHYLCGEYDPDGDYSVNFSRNRDRARRFNSWVEARNVIDRIVSQFELDPEYSWTPVVETINK